LVGEKGGAWVSKSCNAWGSNLIRTPEKKVEKIAVSDKRNFRRRIFTCPSQRRRKHKGEKRQISLSSVKDPIRESRGTPNDAGEGTFVRGRKTEKGSDSP